MPRSKGNDLQTLLPIARPSVWDGVTLAPKRRGGGAMILFGFHQAEVRIEAARPVLQQGSVGEDRKGASRYGHVLGMEWGADAGDFAEYAFTTGASAPNRLRVRYARALAGAAVLRVSVDGKPVGDLKLASTGGWGDRESEFGLVSLALPRLKAGAHRVRFTVPRLEFPVAARKLAPASVLDLVGNRGDKNSVGHAKNVALYTGLPSRFFYATMDLTDVFSAADGQTMSWFPDHVVVTPQGNAPANANLDEIVLDVGNAPLAAEAKSGVFEQRQVCVTKDDVVVSRVFVTNRGRSAVRHRVEVTGDCRASKDYRGRPGGEKRTRREGDTVVLTDRNVFPSVLPNGLTMAVGGSVAPSVVEASRPGAYRMAYDVEVPSGKTVSLTLACAIGRDEAKARGALSRVLGEKDALQRNRDDWSAFYAKEVPAFTSSDKKLDELYAFRWFLLHFSRAGGDLGLLKYPVVLEGRQAFQTYCCYSAPFMAFDLNWATDPQYGYGQIANMGVVAFPDGRFPWYATPQTNRIPIQHASETGQSALPWAAWRHYEVHRRKDLIAGVYSAMKADVDWWIRDRDKDGNGLFTIDDQMETGMDDLDRRWKGAKPKQYEAMDATAYAVLNLRAVANMARVLGDSSSAAKYSAYADKATRAMETVLWDPSLGRYRDRSPDTGELSDYNAITIFYPLFAGTTTRDHLEVVRRYLLNSKEYWTKHPVPAVSQSDPEYDTEKRYWAGPTWPATNSHVVEGLASTAKRLDRSLLPQAAELFRRAVALHLQPRPDFYEHYNSQTGAPKSTFRDYMHSWWIDVVVRHVAGLTPQADGGLVIDPLPLGLKHYSLKGAPYAGRRVDVQFDAKGLTVRVNGREVRKVAGFVPGGKPVTISAAELNGGR
ncbi:hypothetical protein EON82_19255 [bacterium]|nr:MAG: hypothetical protein EON82_19255 [bacterium]